MSQWMDVGAVDEFAAGRPVCRQVRGKAVVVMQVDGAWFAIADVCPHAGKPIGQGELRGRVLRCPFHGYAYDVASGRNVDWPHDEPGLRRYEAREQAGRVQVRVQDA